jgi:putative copper export protein
MLPIDLETVRLFLHVLAATVWVGGQLVLAAVVPALRRAGSDVPRVAARAFNRVAWPAFGVLVATGIWNIVAEGDRGSAYRTTLHARTASRRGMAVFGALTGLTALGALLLGIVLAS